MSPLLAFATELSRGWAQRQSLGCWILDAGSKDESKRQNELSLAEAQGTQREAISIKQDHGKANEPNCKYEGSLMLDTRALKEESHSSGLWVFSVGTHQDLLKLSYERRQIILDSTLENIPVHIKIGMN